MAGVGGGGGPSEPRFTRLHFVILSLWVKVRPWLDSAEPARASPLTAAATAPTAVQSLGTDGLSAFANVLVIHASSRDALRLP